MKDLDRRWHKKENPEEESAPELSQNESSNVPFASSDSIDEENTFLTGVGLETGTSHAISVATGGSHEQPPQPSRAMRWGGSDLKLKIKSGELQAAVLDTHDLALLKSTQEMPEKVHIHEIMDVTTEVINLKGRSKKNWDAHFRSETTQAIIKVNFPEYVIQLSDHNLIGSGRFLVHRESVL